MPADRMTTFYKVTGPDGASYNGGTGTYHLPTTGNRPGKWMPKVTPVVPCKSGYHLVTIEHLLTWIGPDVWVAEGRGTHVYDGDKHVFAQARLVRKTAWDERSARLFAADCAEHALPIFERGFPDDVRPRRAIETGRAYVRGQATEAELAAARSAAWAAGAAGDAARSAAWAAKAAARAAARDAARSAAWAAAEDAAGAAAEAAAEDAAWDAAEDAARAAARAAAEGWQVERLQSYLDGEAK